MDGVVVKRSRGDDGDDSKYYLSVLSPEDFSLSENYDLPFFEKYDAIEGNSCRGLLYFHEYEGKAKSVLCNLTTKELKFLPPPELEPPPNFALFTGIGLGYDSKSRDYKVIRNFAQYYSEIDEDGRSLYRGSTDKTELYSLKTGSWKEIPNPDASICQMSAVYIRGKCYWTAILGGSTWLEGVLSFDFVDESFGSFSLPPIKEASDTIYEIVAFHGSVGAIGYPRPGASKSSKRSRVSSKSFEVWVWREMSWSKVYTVALRHIERPLGLKDGRFLFLEAKHRGQPRQLAVYDLLTNVRNKLKIYDSPRKMKVYFYAQTRDPLPDAKPLDGSHTKDEEDKEATGAMTMTMTRTRKMKRKKKGKRTRTRTRTRTGNVEESSKEEEDDSNNETRPKKRRRLASSH
ncbi:hypothetical protein OROHE_018634 [Orobanche hederae]